LFSPLAEIPKRKIGNKNEKKKKHAAHAPISTLLNWVDVSKAR
jgi:hypothetical protein